VPILGIGDSIECKHNVTNLNQGEKMKRLLGLAVLLAVLSVCVPSSYGDQLTYHYLIYNVSTTVNGADANTDAKATIPLKGYLVLYFVDGCDTPWDANLILYGNDTNSPKKQKVYVQLNARGDDFLTASGWTVGDLMFLKLVGDAPFNFDIMLQGKRTLKDIGFGTADKRMAAASIKGVDTVVFGFLLGPGSQAILGTANASATLNAAVTKQVNENGWGPNAAEDILLSLLLNKGYVAAILPPL
jgi:hypothetical protein